MYLQSVFSKADFHFTKTCFAFTENMAKAKTMGFFVPLLITMPAYFTTLLIAACTACTVAMAQDPAIRNINNISGLPSTTVYNMLQDKKGYVWIAHDRGLSRYDGKTFKTYTSKTQTSRSLSNLMQDGQGRVWCQDFTGNFYYTVADSLQWLQGLPSTGSFRSASILKGNLLFSTTDSAVRCFNMMNNHLQTAALHDNTIQNHTADDGNGYILGTKNLYQFNGKSIAIIAKTNRLNTGHYLVKSSQGFFQIQRSVWPYIQPIVNTNYQQPTLPTDLFIQSINNITGGEIWMATSKGAYCFDEQMQPLYEGHCFFVNYNISGVMKDAEGNYWFSTIGNGILLVPEIRVRLFANAGGINVLSRGAKADNILAGTAKNQLQQFNTSTHSFTTLFDAKVAHEATSLYQAFNNTIVYCGDKTYFLDNQKLVGGHPLSVKSCVAISPKLCVIAYTSGIAILSFNNMHIANVPAWLLPFVNPKVVDKFDRLDLVTATRGRSVAYNPVDSTIYAATTKGLLYWNPQGAGSIKNGKAEIYATQLKMADGQLYAATFNNGIYIIINNMIVKNISTTQGLAGNTVYKFEKSGSKIWMISDDLLQVYDEAGTTTQKYDYTDGLPPAELKDIAIQDGTVYVATTAGLVTISETQNSINKVSPRVEINSIKLKETGRQIDSAAQLAVTENSIVIDFSVLAFRADKNIQVAYRVNDADWQLLEADARQLNLPALSPGSYTIQLKAFNEDGFVSQKIVSCNFSIQAPFYKRLWFLLPLALLSGAIIYVLMQRRINRIRKTNTLQGQKLKLEQDLQKSMLSSIKSQMNPHFIFNALNTIQSFIYSNNKQEANAYLAKFSHLMRMVLEMSNHETVLLEEEIKALKLYLEMEQVRFDDTLEFSFIKDHNVGTNQIRIPSMIIQPYVENAIKHGLLHRKTNRQLLIHFSMAHTGNVLHVTIDDNGIGRKNSAALNQRRTNRFASFSSAANQKRLEILNMDRKLPIVIIYIDKTDQHGNASGTTVQLNIPIT